jgi:hypothetical protein
MDGHKLVRLHELFTDIDAGTSPLTKDDVLAALRTALDAADDAGDAASVVNWDVILATLEAQMTKKEG